MWMPVSWATALTRRFYPMKLPRMKSGPEHSSLVEDAKMVLPHSD